MACKEVPSVCCMVSLLITTIFGGAGRKVVGEEGGKRGGDLFGPFFSCNLPCVVFCLLQQKNCGGCFVVECLQGFLEALFISCDPSHHPTHPIKPK